MRAPVPVHLSRARWAVAALFWLNGAALASVAARYPEIIVRLGVSKSVFGLICAIGPVGGLISGLFTARMLRRWTSARVAVWAQLVQVALTACLLNAPTPAVFAVLIFSMSFTDAFTDIAMNSHGLRVQEEYGRSINNTFHAFWSVGAVAGGLVGATCAGLNVPMLVQGVGFAGVMVAVDLALRPHLLPGPDHDTATADPPPGRPPRRLLGHLVLLGLIAMFACMIEDGGFTWSALYLSQALGASQGIAGLGVVFLVGAQTLGRFTGDRFVDALGNRTVARISATVATVGMATALLLPSVPITLAGFALAGWGVATLVPAVFATADSLPGLRHGSGLTVVNWLLRTSFFVGPPVVGCLADHAGFRVALAIMPLATTMVVVLSGALRPKASARPA